MADDKDDNGLKKAEEALKKAEKNPAFVGPQDSPKFKAAVEQLQKARANFEAAGGVSGATPPIIDPRGREGLDLPPATTAPNLGGSGQLAPESMLSNRDTIVDQARAAAPLDTTTLLSNPVTIANQAREGKSKKTPEEKAANKIKRLAKQAAQRRQDDAAKKAAYDRGVAERARQSKVDSEAVRAIRERHDKDKPSAWEMGLAGLSGGLLGGLMGTYDRYFDSSRAANEEVENFRLKNASDEAKRKALVAAKNTAARDAAARYGWNASAIKAAGDAKSVLTSNAYAPYLFKEGTPNPLSGIDTNKNGDSKQQILGWFDKRLTQAIKGNKKAIAQIGAASSRIAMKEELYKKYLEKDLVILDNKYTYENKLYATVPKHGVEASEAMASIDYMWADKESLQKQIETWETLNAYYQMYDMLAANADPEGKYADFAASWGEITANPNSPVLKSVSAMKDMAEEFKITITAQQRNLRDVRDAGRMVTDINAKIKGLEDDDNHDEAIWLRENELPEAEQYLNLTLLFSGHSDLTVGRGEDGGVEVYDAGTNVKLITQRFTPDGRSVADVNYEEIDSLHRSGKITESEKKALIQKANETVAEIESNWRLSGGPAISPDTTEGDAMKELKYNAWVDNNPEEFVIVQDGIKLIVDHIIAEERKGNTAAYAEAKLGVGLNKRQQQIMRSPFAKHMLLLWKVADDEAKAAAKKKSDEGN
jgi:hypothetical protein